MLVTCTACCKIPNKKSLPQMYLPSILYHIPPYFIHNQVGKIHTLPNPDFTNILTQLTESKNMLPWRNYKSIMVIIRVKLRYHCRLSFIGDLSKDLMLERFIKFQYLHGFWWASVWSLDSLEIEVLVLCMNGLKGWLDLSHYLMRKQNVVVCGNQTPLRRIQ